MFRTGTLSLALIAGLFSMQGCNEAPVSADEESVKTDVPVTRAGSEKEQTRDHGEDDDFALYVSSGGTDNVLAYDGETGAFERKFARHGGLIEPEGIAFGRDGNLYVSSRSNAVLRYDGETGKFIDVFASGHGLVDPAGIAFGGPGNDLFVSSGLTDDGRGNQILRFDGTTGAFKGVFITAGLGGLNEAEGMAFGPNGNLLIASELGNAVLEYDGTTGAFVREFVAEGSGRLTEPTFIIFGPSEH